MTNDEWSPIHPTSIHLIIRFERNAGVLLKAATEAKTVPKFTEALQRIWSALPEKAIDNTVKDNRKRLQACVSANGGNFEHIMWQFI